MERVDLEAKWERARAHLGRALAAFDTHGGGSEARAAALDYLDHNELELSADVLADAAEDLDVPELWAALAAAAHEMHLNDRVVQWVARTNRYPCPCCGHLVFNEPPGSYAICPVCFWEDDVVQLRWPESGGGANRPSLIEAQREYVASGAMAPRFTEHVRGASPDEPAEPGWRLVDLATDNFEPWGATNESWPDDYTTLYWWRPTYWRRVTARSAPG